MHLNLYGLISEAAVRNYSWHESSHPFIHLYLRIKMFLFPLLYVSASVYTSLYHPTLVFSSAPVICILSFNI